MTELPFKSISPERMERDWRTGAEPVAMLTVLEHLGHFWQPYAVRKLRAFACALLRQVWGGISDGRIRLACQTAELLAGGRGDADMRDADMQIAAYKSARLAECVSNDFEGAAGMLAVMACSPKLSSCLPNWRAAAHHADRLGIPGTVQASHLRCLFEPFCHEGGPSSAAIAMLRTSQGCMALSVAIELSRARRFGDLPLLADQLEAAGLGDCELLRHLRGLHRCAACLGMFTAPCPNCSGSGWLLLPAPHVGGCWALDVLLGF